ncbi:uncharacterized protein LOC144100594 [Amblyomma americanum]
MICYWMGDFSGIASTAKKMARMGQCFSSTEESVQVPLLSNSVREVPDILGGKHPVTDEHYIFSDGIGMISPGLLKEPAATVSCQAPYLSGRKPQACSRHGAFATWVRLPVLGVTDDTRGGGEVPPRGHQDGHSAWLCTRSTAFVKHCGVSRHRHLGWRLQ